MIKHSTASVFVFCCDQANGWRLGLVDHPRLGRAMVPGGHVEDWETAAESALRELTEESGLVNAVLLEASAPDLPGGYPHARIPQPWWITELQVPADNHVAEPHVHVDHQWVAIAHDPIPARDAAHPFAWYGPDDLDALRMWEDTRLLAKMLFTEINDLATGANSLSTLDSRVPHVLARDLHA